MRTVVVTSVVVFCIAVAVLAADAPPGIPSEYWGTLDAEDDLSVTLYVNGQQFGEGFTAGNYYSVIVAGDNSLTYLEDPACEAHNPCIPCSTDASADDFCIEGPRDGESAEILVDGRATGTTVSFDTSSGGGEVAASLEFDANITLGAGFTLFSLPVAMKEVNFVNNGSIFETNETACLTKLFRYNAAADQYEQATFVSGFGWFSGQGFTSLEGGRGYWGKTSKDCLLTIHGEQAEHLNISLYSGFNLVGWYNHRSESLALDTFEVNVTNCISKLFRYNTVSSQYEQATFIGGSGWFSTQGLDALDPSRGYWLKATSDCTWKHNPLAP